MAKYHYRPEIDGLRAIAVLSVVIAHASHHWLPNGHLGVDVFFVISGFLITQILNQEIQQSTFSFMAFYKRRAKRLLPALLTVLLIATPIAFFLFTPAEFFTYLRSLIYSLLFVVNLFFAKQKIDYFGTPAQEQPLLHLWSLSIEEQFYVIFPIILLLAIKYLKDKVIWVVATCILVSLLSRFVPFFEWNTYYLPQIRAYELLMGSFFALLPKKSLPSSVQWGAFLTIILLMFVPKDWVFFAKSYIERLLICISTGLLLWNISQHDHHVLPKHILSQRFFVFFGLISYSLYLWHWVVFAFLKYIYMNSDDIPSVILIFATATSILLAYLTYRWIENPIRNIKHISQQQFLVATLCYLLMIFSLLSLKNYYRHDITTRHEAYFPKGILWDDKDTCHSNLNKAKNNDPSCLKGETSLIKPTILVLGDSHAGQHNLFFDYVGKKEGWLASVISRDACPFLYGYRREDISTENACNEYRDYVETQIHYYDTIVLLGRWEGYIDNGSYDKDFLVHFENTLKYLLGQHKKVYVFLDNPTINHQGARSYHLAQKGLLLTTLRVSPKTAHANQKIETIVKRYPQINIIDINPVIPKDFTVDSLPIYNDINHFNPYGSRKIAERFTKNQTLITQDNHH